MVKTSSMYLYVKLNWDANCFLPTDSKYYDICFDMSASKGAQFVPMEMPIIYWKTFLAKTMKMLLTRNSSILLMSKSSSNSMTLVPF